MAPIIVYEYSYICGGLADFLKFLCHTSDLCNHYRLPLNIHINHPISNYIEWNINYKHMVIQQNQMIGSIFRIDSFQNYYFETFENILKSLWNYDFIIITSLDFFSSNIHFDCLVNDLNFKATIQKQYHLENFLTFSKVNFYVKEKSYICIHVRMGDQHTDIIPSVDYCDTDDRSIEYALLDHHVENILEMTNLEETVVFFLADNNKLRSRMMNKFPNIRLPISTNREEIIILNISYPISDQELYKKGLTQSIYEFELLRNADAIYSLTYSGFTIMANYFRTNSDQYFCKLYT